jgi:hypothetical protein
MDQGSNIFGKSERSPLLARRGGAKRRGGGSITVQLDWALVLYVGVDARSLEHEKLY